jgi:sugar/nucleoside kinase (ribokinase family)
MIYVSGNVAFDYIGDTKNFPSLNSNAYITGYFDLFGGAAGNFCTVCSKLGHKSSLFSLVGEDFRGSAYEKNLNKIGVDLKNLRIIKGSKTARAFMFNDSKGRQIAFFYWGAAGLFSKVPLPDLKMGKDDILHIANGNPYFTSRVAKKYPGVSFDPGYDIHAYRRKELEEVLKNAKILTCNEFEIRRILQLLRMRDKHELFSFPLEYIIVTYGGKGSSVTTREENFEVPAVKAKLVDPTGAGDSFRAAFLSAFLKGESLEMCLKFASSVSSFIVEEYGAQTNIPSYGAAVARLKRYKLA